MKHKSIMYAVTIVCVLGLIGWGFYRLGMHQGMVMSAPASAVAHDSGAKVLYWHDPMVPGHRFDKPGRSPFMDMDLVPVYATEGLDQTGVSIAAQTQQNLGIRSAEVRVGQITPELLAVGNIVWNERTMFVMQARAAGFVERLHVRSTMEKVRQGQVLAEIYVPDWVAAQEDYLATRDMPSEAVADLRQGALQRMRLAGMSAQQIAQVERAGKVQPSLAIVSPINGVVFELGLREGMTVSEGMTMFRINGLDTVWVNAEIPESMAAKVLPGSVVDATTIARPGKVYKGRITALLPEVDNTTRTLQARIELNNPGFELVPGMYASLNLAGETGKESLLVPTEAIIRTGKRNVVFVVEESGNFQAVDVSIGLESQGETEVLKGLKAGQKIVVSGQFLVDSEASLKGASSRMQEMQQ
ncbi:MAG: efflux RND transporter periplasmic adaptor subunit [Moraxellaceae bacterium]|jgi:Cu(I)/Ag(I) efflux system membrane fusion protein|nr:efflux RND transporter periplasmic adaptor subunit [Moraxellaceae bacterium]MDZ4385631.1 efflux RND transporter periplasmic adaptor subunit [Moraxellaceae bacterium]